MELAFSTGRDASQVEFPVPWHRKEGPTQSKIHGSFAFKLIDEPPHGRVVHNIEYSDLGREGTAVYTLPPGTRTVGDIFKNMGNAVPHPETPHLQAGKTAMVRVTPNKTVLVFGVPSGTVKYKHLYAGEYTDASGKRRTGFYDEHGNLYPWAVVYADKARYSKEVATE